MSYSNLINQHCLRITFVLNNEHNVPNEILFNLNYNVLRVFYVITSSFEQSCPIKTKCHMEPITGSLLCHPQRAISILFVLHENDMDAMMISLKYRKGSQVFLPTHSRQLAW